MLDGASPGASWQLLATTKVLERCIKVRTAVSSLNPFNMSGCAVASDGSLLSPSKIDFYDDPDDITPISGPSLVTHGTTARSVSTGPSLVTTLDNHFAPHQPAIKLAGVRRTTRPSKPSACLRDAADTLSNSGTSGKRKANHVLPQRRVARKIVPDPDTDDYNDKNVSNGSTKTIADDTREPTDCDSDSDKVQAAYDQTREMGDEDRKVNLSSQ